MSKYDALSNFLNSQKRTESDFCSPKSKVELVSSYLKAREFIRLGGQIIKTKVDTVCLGLTKVGKREIWIWQVRKSHS